MLEQDKDRLTCSETLRRKDAGPGNDHTFPVHAHIGMPICARDATIEANLNRSFSRLHNGRLGLFFGLPDGVDDLFVDRVVPASLFGPLGNRDMGSLVPRMLFCIFPPRNRR